MRSKALIAASLLLALVSACSVLQPRSSQPERDSEPAPEPRELASELLAFADRLAAAEGDTLEDLGDGLRTVAREQDSPAARLRYAYWRATPGHGGFDPERARRTLERVLADDQTELAPATRALLRLQLRHLHRVRQWRERNADLSRENEQLRDKIRELTDLERRMGSDR